MADHILQRGTPQDRNWLPLASKKGKTIQNERRLEALPERLRAAVAVWERLIPNAQIRSISYTYDCVGMVFAARRTWVDTDQLPMILDDDGYQPLKSSERPEPGDIVLYKNQRSEITHAGVVLEVKPVVKIADWDVKILSKWGGDGEYVHSPSDVPTSYGNSWEYWTERQMP